MAEEIIKTEDQNNAPSNSNETVYSILCYLGILWIVPYFAVKERSEFLKHNMQQGLSVLLVYVIAMVVSYISGTLGGILNVVALVFVILGIINVVKKDKKDIPLVGGLFKNLNF